MTEDAWVVAYQSYPESKDTGGQQTGRVWSGIKATCQRTGLIAISVEERSQHRNKAVCDAMLKAGYTAMGIEKALEK